MDFQVPRSPISGLPGPQISKFPDFQVPRFPDFQTRELSDPNLTPLSTYPGIKYVARSPCCDKRPAPMKLRHLWTRPYRGALDTAWRLASTSSKPHDYPFEKHCWYLYLANFCDRLSIFTALLGSVFFLEMIMSHRAPSSFTMSLYRVIWTHFRHISSIVIPVHS